MSVIKLKNKETGEYTEIIQEAIETPVEDVLNLFENKNVESILQEIGLKIKNGVATPEDIALLKRMLQTLSATVNDLKNNGGNASGIEGIDIDVLKEMIQKYEDGELGAGSIEGVDMDILKEMIVKYENGDLGGGSGAVSPTIESDFPTESIIEEGSSISIDIYFQTPNLGDGKLYITVNNVEIDYSPTIKQGDNKIAIAAKYLTKTNNTISIYAKDRVGMTSNRLTFKVVSGGVTLTTTFDYTVDYVVGQNILFPFTTVTELEGEIYLYTTIDGIELEPMKCNNGYNSFYLNEHITGVGSHSVSMYAMVGSYKSKVLNFNVVIASSTELTLSTSTLSGTEFTYGESIQISYRVSKLGNETFTMSFYVDEELKRTSSVSTGSYFWTIAAGEIPLGTHTIKIKAEGTSGDSAEVEIQIVVVAGTFKPIEIIKSGLTCWLDSDGYSNEMEERTIWVDKSGKGNNGELINFNFATNGWNPTLTELVPDETDPTGSISKTIEYKGLVCNNDAYVRIPYKALVNNALNGFTLEMVYTPEHSGNNKARVLEYVDHDAPYVGIYADIDEAFIKSESETTAGQIDLDYESGEIQLDFVIDREKKLCLLYIDGICTRYWTLADSGNKRESFAIDQEYIYLNFSALSKEFCGGTNVIRKFLCYERALSHDDIVNNWIANQPDLITMEEKHNWCYKTQIPKVQIYGDISNCSSSVPAYVRIKYISTDEEKYGASFDLESANSPIYLQGTSSLGYARKNYRFILIDNNGQEYFHEMFPGNALPESTYTVKCDYVDSSMTCNVTLCKIANDTLYGPGFTVAQKDNPARRTATYGHAIELVNIVNNEEISLGAYTIIIDRYAEKSMGYDQKEYPNILVAEGESNSDTGASSFHSYSNPESSGSQFPNETAYINEGFRIVYPPTNEDAYDFAPLKELVNFVDLASDDDFKDTFESYFDKESVLKYYLFCLCFASVDTLAKNLHFVRYKDVWYVLPYDLDSVLGGSNVGFLNISSSCEVGNIYDEENPDVIVEPNQFNSWNGRLWERMRNTFGADLKAMWTTLRANGTFNYDNFIKYFDEIWDVLPPTMYNASQQIKYIDYGTTGQVALHGNRKHQIKKFLRERLAYLDSKFEFYSDGGSENYVNIRMNTLGDVSLTVETYYPVYYTIKWATNNIETHRIAKNTKKTFSYFSDVSTDREVLLYLPHTLKKIEGLDSLKPASIDISKATKLNEIECHSEKLYSVSLANNKYLRTIDFNGCNKLGTDTVSTLSIIYAKYLKYLDVRGTKLTAINFSNQGGSLQKCYLPNTLTTLNIKNQLLLTDLILPYSNDGSEMAKDLATVEIENCPAIVNISEVTGKDMFDVFRSCRSLILNNSFTTLSSIVFDGFTRLQNVNLSNIDSLVDLGLNDLCNVGETSSLRYIGISACKNLKTITMNCTSNDYEITFAKKSLLDLSTSNVTEIHSNCVIKGLETIILPKSIENMYFAKEYGEGYSDIKNIWSASAAVVDSSGVFPSASHMDFNTSLVDDYEGIDFYGLHLYNIDLGSLVNIPDAINFSLYPTTVNPNFNLNRDGETYPYLQPSGVLDLSNYTESLARFFNGVDLNKLVLACRNNLPQTDLSYCFYGSTFDSVDKLNALLKRILNVSNMEYCFYKTSIDSTEILNNINMKPGTSLAYAFGYCENITELNDVTISALVESVEGMFQGSNLTTVNNFTVLCENIKALFKDCPKLMTVNNFKAENTTSYESLFEGDIRLTIPPIKEIPEYVTNINNMHKNCSGMVSIDGMVFHANLTDYEGFIDGCSSLTNANNITIKGNYFSDFFKGWTSIKYMNNLLTTYIGKSMSFNNMLEGMVNLIEFSFHDDSYVKDVVSMDYMCKGTNISKIDLTNVNFERLGSAKYLLAESNMRKIEFHLPSTISNITGLLSNCPNLEEIYNVTFSHYITRTTDWLLNSPLRILRNCTVDSNLISFANCNTLEVIDNLLWKNQDFGGKFAGCTSLKTATINFADTVTSLGKTVGGFENCPSLTFIDFLESTLPNLATFNRLFNGDTSLTAINNFRISNTTATCGNEVLTGCPISNTDGLIINSQAALEMFKLGSESKITAVTDFELGPNVKNLSNLFREYQLMTHDMAIPSHVENTSGMYQDCLGLTHVTSNWTNNYNIGEINSENCYAGCTNISHIDNELYMNEYGELTAIYNIPQEWGGILDLDSYANVFEIVIEDETNLTVSFEGLEGDQLTEWGDLSISRSLTHTYPAPGRYIVKTNLINPLGLGKGTAIDSTLASLVTKIYKLTDTEFTSASYLFKGFSNLKELCKLTLNLPNPTYMFADCIKIPNIDISSCTFSGTDFSYMCLNCTFSKINFTIPDTAKNIDYIFGGCNNLIDISGMVFGSGITSATNWAPPNLKYANNVIDKSSFKLFKGNTTIQYVKNISRPNSTNWDNYFEGCISLKEDIIFPSNTVSVVNCFKNCTSMTHIHSNWKNNYTNGITATDCYTGCTVITHIDDVDIGVNEYHSGLDEIPKAWGGYEFTKESTFILKLEISSDNYSVNLASILGDGTVSWGDGTSTVGELTHTYSTAGTYVIKGKFMPTAGVSFANENLRNTVTEVHQIADNFEGKLARNLFREFRKLTYVNLNNWNRDKKGKSTITEGFVNCVSLCRVDALNVKLANNSDLYQLFMGCSSLSEINGIETWDVSCATSMGNMVKGCYNLTSSDLSSWDVSKVNNMSNMFEDCKKWTDFSFMKSWDLSSVTAFNTVFARSGISEFSGIVANNIKGYINGCFQNCSNLTKVSYEGMNLINVTGNFYIGFTSCSSLKEVSFKNTNLQFTSAFAMFEKCDLLETIDFTSCHFNYNSDSVAYNFGLTNSVKNIIFSENSFEGAPTVIINSTSLTVDSLLSLFNALVNIPDSRTLKIGSTNLAKLSPEQIKIATDKGWTVV